MYLNGDGCLLILVCCEDLGFLGGDDGVPGNQFCHHSTDGFDTQGERGNIQEKNICMTK